MDKKQLCGVASPNSVAIPLKIAVIPLRMRKP